MEANPGNEASTPAASAGAADPERQRKQDEEHLKLLSIFYYVSGSLTALVALFPLLYGAFGVMMLTGGAAVSKPGPEAVVPVMFGGCFAIAGAVFGLIGGTLAALKFYAGHSIAQHRNRTFCLVVAGLTCLAIPYGTLLGVFTFVVLGRPSVEKMFDAGAA